MKLHRYENRSEMGTAAGKAVEAKLLELLRTKEELRVIFAAAPSQSDTLAYLRKSNQIPWRRITAFHMDEYIGLSDSSPALFSNFLRHHLFDHVSFKAVHYINGLAEIDAEIARYSALLQENPIDLVCLGIGENGHIAFNDPPVADFLDNSAVKKVELDLMCRQQQVNDGCFENLEEVPKQAITLTIPTIINASHLICVVPGQTKKAAVHDTLFGPISTACPASFLRTLNNCDLFVDQDSSPEIQVLKDRASKDIIADELVYVDEQYGVDFILPADFPTKTYLAPGLVDLQINGINGIDFNSIELTKENVLAATQYLLSKGVTLFCPTLITGTKDTMFHLLGVIRDACEVYPLVNDCVLGVHLEGPFISPEDGARGAHPKDCIQNPSLGFLEEAIAISDNRIALITLAPERENSLEFIAACVDKGIKVAIGHSMAKLEDIKASVEAGLSMVTHLGNAVPLMLKRHPNILWDLLAEENLSASLIADGCHVPDEFLKVAFKVKGDKSFLVSDATAFAGMPPGEYDAHIGGKVVLDANGKLSMKGSNGMLAGAARDLLQNVEYLVDSNLLSLSDAWKKGSVIPAGYINGDNFRITDRVIFEKSATGLTIRKVIKNNENVIAAMQQ
ncbi:MAG TPA: 6-phosphogluconolactonase [Lunatimonas sp.]|nr:6-phosphogluconolactonase [Lunatimonas sp.]